MATMQDSEGLQVDSRENKAPEAVTQSQDNKPANLYDNTSANYYDNNNTPNNHYVAPGYLDPSQRRPQQRVPFGLGVWKFAALVALITALIVGGGVRGGLGATLASCQSSDQPSSVLSTACPTPSSSPSSSEEGEEEEGTYAPKAASQVRNLTIDCPEDQKTGKSYRASNGYEFKWYCGTDAPANLPAEEGGVIKDIAPMLAYSVEDCMYACAQVMEADKTQQTCVQCRSVVFSSTMAETVEEMGVNCWLKNGTKERGTKWIYDRPSYAYAEVA